MVTMISFVIVLGILVFIHELGHFVVAKLSDIKVEKFSLGFGPRLISKKIGETDYILSVLPLGGYVKTLGEEVGEELKEEDKPRAFNYQPVWKRAAIVFAGPVFNFILAYIIFVAFLGLNLPVAIPDLDRITDTTIEHVREDSPAMKAGMKAGDLVVSINGETISTWIEMEEKFLKNPGKELLIKIKRGSELIDIRITPEPTKIVDKDGKEQVIGRIGIKGKFPYYPIQSSSILMVPVKGFEAVYDWSILTLKVVGKLLTGTLSVKQIGGPILIMDTAAKATSAGPFDYFNFIAIISINLAILNLFPIPVLDGGHLMFMFIEALRGKPLSNRAISVATRAGIAILLVLVAVVLYNDILRVVVPWSKKTLNP